MQRRMSPLQRPTTTSLSCSEHELRLQELTKLASRHQATDPGPGHYEVVVEAFQQRGAHRPHQQHLDGPFQLRQGQASTRAHQLDSCLLLRDSGLSPAAYNSSNAAKATNARAATPKVGTARRCAASSSSPSLGPNHVCVSLSRSLAAGLDWRQQLTLAQVQQHLASTHAQWAGAVQVPPSVRLPPAAAGHHLGPRAATAGVQWHQKQQQQQQHSDQPQQLRQLQQEEQQEQEQGEQQQQQQHLQQQLACTSSGGKRQPQQAQHTQRASGSGGGSSSSCKARALPWQLAASLAHHEHLIQALRESVTEPQQVTNQQQQLGLASPYGTGAASSWEQQQPQQQPQQQQQQQSQMQAQQGGLAQQQQPVVVVMQPQEVLQHRSAARAATAAHASAARRRQWEQLSCAQPAPYPVFLPGGAGSREGAAAGCHTSSTQ